MSASQVVEEISSDAAAGPVISRSSASGSVKKLTPALSALNESQKSSPSSVERLPSSCRRAMPGILFLQIVIQKILLHGPAVIRVVLREMLQPMDFQILFF